MHYTVDVFRFDLRRVIWTSAGQLLWLAIYPAFGCQALTSTLRNYATPNLSGPVMHLTAAKRGNNDLYTMQNIL